MKPLKPKLLRIVLIGRNPAQDVAGQDLASHYDVCWSKSTRASSWNRIDVR